MRKRVSLALAAYRILRYVFKSDVPIDLKRITFDQCVSRVLTVGTETSILTLINAYQI